MKPLGAVPLVIRPITFKAARAFVKDLHRHNPSTTGCKFCLSVYAGEKLVGVAVVGRPVARAFDDGLTIEVNRVATDGAMNACSALYAAAWRVAKAMGYETIITYTQHEETGASMRGAGWVRVRDITPRKSWAESSVKLRDKKDPVGVGGVARVLWRCGAPLLEEVLS